MPRFVEVIKGTFINEDKVIRILDRKDDYLLKIQDDGGFQTNIHKKADVTESFTRWFNEVTKQV